MILYVVSECFRECWQTPQEEPSRVRIIAVYSNETSARTHVQGPPREWMKQPPQTVGRYLRIEAFEVDSLREEARPS